MPNLTRVRSLVILVGVLLAILPACHRKPRAATPVRRVASAADVAEAAPELDRSLYDADGNLLATEVRYMGFEIPAGFELKSSINGVFRYESSRVPLEKLRQYIGHRIETTHIRVIGESAYFYTSATVHDVPSEGHLLDVSARNVTNGVVLDLQDRPPVEYPAGTTQADREQAISAAWRDQSRRE